MEKTINNLIKQTKEEIEDVGKDCTLHCARDKVYCIDCFRELRMVEAKLSILQTAKDIFIKMLDEAECYCELCAFTGNHEDNEDKLVNVKEIKSQLLGDKSRLGGKD